MRDFQAGRDQGIQEDEGNVGQIRPDDCRHQLIGSIPLAGDLRFPLLLLPETCGSSLPAGKTGLTFQQYKGYKG